MLDFLNSDILLKLLSISGQLVLLQSELDCLAVYLLLFLTLLFVQIQHQSSKIKLGIV
jgi:hypothetical protein